MSISIYTGQDLYFFRKPTGIASTRGDQSCFLDFFVTNQFPDLDFASLGGRVMDQLFQKQLKELSLSFLSDRTSIVTRLCKQFTKDQEWGLLNRLDTDTSGFLYFAKTQDVYHNFSGWQKENKISKRYLARVWGDPVRNFLKRDMPFAEQKENGNLLLHFPIMHHRDLPQTMIGFLDEEQMQKNRSHARGKVHTSTTEVEILTYDETNNESIVLATITQGVRHQIRVHLAVLGNPILGDTLYNKQTDNEILQLISCGCTSGDVL